MARKTKQIKSDIQLPILKRHGNGNSISLASTTSNSEMDAILASVLRVFAARGRAIREAHEKQKGDEMRNKIA